MKLLELIDQVEWSGVKKYLLSKYPGIESQIEKFHSVFDLLQQIDFVRSDMRLIIQKTYREGIDDQQFIEVIGKDGTLNKELNDFKYLDEQYNSDYANAEAEYALSLTPWEKWLGMTVDRKTLEKFTAKRVVAHCLREMTFHGFKQSDIQETKEELNKRINELNAMTEEERKEHLVPWEEVKKNLKDKYSTNED